MSVNQGEDDMSKKTRHCLRKGRSCLPPRCKKNGESKKPCGSNRKPASPFFSEQVFADISTTDDFIALPPQDTSNKSVYSYAVVNKGSEPVLAQVEIGPNGRDYTIDVEEVVPTGATAVVVPARFQRFTRLLVRSLNVGKPTGVTVYFQSQRAR